MTAPAPSVRTVCDGPVCDGPVCSDVDRRRQDVVEGCVFNGIDDVEVVGVARGCTLLVRCLRDVPAELRAADVTVTPDGPAPRRPVTVVWAYPSRELAAAAAADPDVVTAQDVADFGSAPATVLVVRTTGGDGGPYRLAIQHPGAHQFDPRLSCVGFSYAVDARDLDCAARPAPAPPTAPEPVLDYLNRDYTGLRGMLLDRLSVRAPTWTDRNIADVGVTLVELFAYLGDYLAAAQDAVAAEAYLGTARQRVSVARHARLLDYAMHQGAAARVWLVLTATADADADAMAKRRVRCTPDGEAVYESVPAGTQVRSVDGKSVFHTLYPTTPREARNAIDVYAWGGTRCVLPKGSTRATLVGTAKRLALRAGDVLLFEEVPGPDATTATADATHRWPVRLAADPCDTRDPVTGTKLVEVAWHEEDELPFDLSLRRFPGRRCFGDSGAAVAHGNVVLAEHGLLVEDEAILPPSAPARGRYRPVLGRPGLAHRQPYSDAAARLRPAAEALVVDPRRAVADVVALTDGYDVWEVRRDLLGSDRFATHVVVEMTDDGLAQLRFGDNAYGRRPAPDRRFTATYRVGGGAAGNVGRDVLIVFDQPLAGITVRNPMAATGGAEAERVEPVRQFAPQAFRKQERAVTDADYATLVQRDPRVQRAVATRRWTGSWYTEFVTVDRRRGAAVDSIFRAELTRRLDRFRMAGADVEVVGPVLVPLAITLAVCVAPGYGRGTVAQALIDRFSVRDLPGGGRGFFHPDELTFAQPVYLSRIIAAAMSVTGVAWVSATRFERRDEPQAGEPPAVLAMGRLEVASCDSDPAHPDRGLITFELTGGL